MRIFASTSALAIEDSRFVLDVCVLPLCHCDRIMCDAVADQRVCVAGCDDRHHHRRRSTPQVPPLASPPPLAPASSPLTNVSVRPTRSPASPLHPAQLLVEPRIESSIEPGVKPSVEPSVEPRVEPRVEPHEPHELSAAEPCKPRAAEPRELCASKSERARSRARERDSVLQATAAGLSMV